MRAIGCLLLLLLPLTLFATNEDIPVFEGHVLNVVSGDIIRVKSGEQIVEVRLAGIDSPDEQQAYGPESIETLKNLVLNKNVIVRDTGTDACGRVIGLVWIEGDNGLDISSRMVDAGATWVYRQYTNSQELIDLENKANSNKLGLWNLPHDKRMPPWEWRKQAKLSGKQPKDSCYVKADEYLLNEQTTSLSAQY